MTKKLKIKELEDDLKLPTIDSDIDGQAIEKISLDELRDEISENNEIKKISVKENIIVREKIREDIASFVYFKRSLVFAFLTKAISTIVILVFLEFVAHLLKYLDGINIKDRENFSSLFFGGEHNIVFCKILALLIVIYFLANKDDIAVNKKGLYVVNSELVDSVFFSPKRVYLQWERIKKAKLKIRFFEPHLFFYDEAGDALGHLEFSVAEKEKFFKYIEENAGKNHPLMKVKNEGMLF